jgi:hypothetical protein
MYSLEHELILLNLRHRITHATRNSRFSHGWDLDPSLMRPKPIIPGRRRPLGRVLARVWGLTRRTGTGSVRSSSSAAPTLRLAAETD